MAISVVPISVVPITVGPISVVAISVGPISAVLEPILRPHASFNLVLGSEPCLFAPVEVDKTA